MEFVYMAGRVSDLRNKTVEQLRELRDLGMREISLGTESGDDWTLDCVYKGYHAEDIIEQCAKLDEANRGEFDPLTEREMLEEVLLFVENLTCDCTFITHHTIGGENLTGPDFLGRKDEIVAALRDQIENGDLDTMTRIRAMKRSL